MLANFVRFYVVYKRDEFFRLTDIYLSEMVNRHR